MADSRDITGKNRKFKGTSGIVLPKGTQAQRADTESGEIRFNTDTNLAEYYDGTEWKSIDSPPIITGVSPASPVDDGSTTTEITITGSNLQSGGTLSIIGNDATVYNVSSFTIVSSTSITFNYTSALAAAGVNTPYDITYENASGLSATLEDGFTPNTGPVWVSPAANSSLGSINLGANASTLTQISVTDTAGGTLVYSISSGALPGGVTINSATGAISGVTNSSGTFTFTIQVTDGTTAITRQFTATVINPYITATGGTETTSGDYKIHTFTSPGNFVVSGAGTPAGSTQVDYLVVAGGGMGGSGHGAGGGAGGFRESHSTPVSGPYTASPLATPTGITVSATTYPVVVGAGATAAPYGGSGQTGAPSSSFATITSSGGGFGGAFDNPSLPGGPGGSGGGGGNGAGTGTGGGGSGNSPPVSPPQGNNGSGNGPNGGPWAAAGGGGATNNGNPGPSNSSGGPGGSGATTSISGSPTAYSGGGGGNGGSGSAGTGGTGGGAPGNLGGQGTASSGAGNRGGGGGGARDGQGGNGGSGIVIIRYKYQ